MIKKYNATIVFDTKNNHPDDKNINNLKYNDIYTVDTDYFNDNQHIINYIKNDMRLVAGGGYETNTIKNVKFTILAN